MTVAYAITNIFYSPIPGYSRRLGKSEREEKRGFSARTLTTTTPKQTGKSKMKAD